MSLLNPSPQDTVKSIGNTGGENVRARGGDDPNETASPDTGRLLALTNSETATARLRPAQVLTKQDPRGGKRNWTQSPASNPEAICI